MGPDGKCDPNPHVISGGQQVAWPAFNTNLWGLTGRIGDYCFSAGNQYVGEPGSCGEIELTMNDDLKGDNCGGWSVQVSVSGDCTPTEEICGNLRDDDCDCQIDEESCPVCGDGVLAPGEPCDIGIETGPGACPSADACDDGDPCTSDGLEGEACLAQCVHSFVAADPSAPDGCCAPGLTKDVDADCPIKCGTDPDLDCIDPCAEVACNAGHYCADGQCVDPSAGAGGFDLGPAAEGVGGDASSQQHALGFIDAAADGACACGAAGAPGHGGGPGRAVLAALLGLLGLVRRRR
ncbi:MAG: hypothetical protein HY744_09990 [Deltaproteobacteria bacterium]|nr:hypothetical protein [Deltaproteobacteria bacterium]